LYDERETVIMRRCISALAKVGHIRQITDGRWLFKALLAAKPHQDHVRHIKDFVWRFCINYIPLNGVTRIIAYPIPRCDSAQRVRPCTLVVDVRHAYGLSSAHCGTCKPREIGIPRG
jgi:hypothetical protein